jgi:alpha-beta hydrolase superfamily lysophospholipase
VRPVTVVVWDPEIEHEDVRGVIHLVHGSCEHIGRYTALMALLAQEGFAVVGSNLRGHGEAAAKAEDLGYFGEEDGWWNMVDDLHAVNTYAAARWSDKPIIMLGHSMGSFLARTYAFTYPDMLAGLILSGTAHYSGALLFFGRSVATWEKRFRGSKHRSLLLNKLSYDSFNHHFAPPRTSHDWLSRDEAAVDAYLADPLCGFVFTTTGFRDMFSGLTAMITPDNIARTRKDLPILMMSGQDDPVGSYGKTVRQAYDAYEKAGLTNVTLHLYKDMRHEIFNERDNEEVTADLLQWLGQYE